MASMAMDHLYQDAFPTSDRAKRVGLRKLGFFGIMLLRECLGSYQSDYSMSTRYHQH